MRYDKVLKEREVVRLCYDEVLSGVERVECRSQESI